MNGVEGLGALGALGFSWPSPAYLFGAILFGCIGMGAWRVGRRQDRPVTVGLAVALMAFPYLVTRTPWLYAVGIALCAGLWWDARR